MKRRWQEGRDDDTQRSSIWEEAAGRGLTLSSLSDPQTRTPFATRLRRLGAGGLAVACLIWLPACDSQTSERAEEGKGEPASSSAGLESGEAGGGAKQKSSHHATSDALEAADGGEQDAACAPMCPVPGGGPVQPKPGLIDLSQARTLLAKGGILVDLRTAVEFEAGHLAGAVNIPERELLRRSSELGAKGRSIVLYCSTGAKSDHASLALEQAGYTAIYDLGAQTDLKALDKK